MQYSPAVHLVDHGVSKNTRDKRVNKMHTTTLPHHATSTETLLDPGSHNASSHELIGRIVKVLK